MVRPMRTYKLNAATKAIAKTAIMLDATEAAVPVACGAPEPEPEPEDPSFCVEFPAVLPFPVFKALAEGPNNP